MFTFVTTGVKMRNIMQVGDPPHLVRGALIQRKKSYADIAREVGCSRVTVSLLIAGKTTSARISRYINSILKQPVPQG